MTHATPTYVGIDLARRAKHKVVVLRGDGATPRTGRGKSFSFAHDGEGFLALLDYLRKQTDGASVGDMVVTMEPTSGVWQSVAGFLRAHGAEVFFTRTDVVSQVRKVHSKFAKSDRIDAHTLAALPVSFPHRLIPAVAGEPRVETLRQRSAQRQRLVEDATRWKNRLIAKLEPLWPSLIQRLDREQRFSQLARAFFRHFPHPRDVVRLGHDRFLTWCRKNAHGRTAASLFETFWQGAGDCAAMWELLDGCQAITIDWDSLHELVHQDLRLLETLEEEIAKLDQRIRDARADVPECDIVEQLPGIGPVVAPTVTTSLLPVTRFPSAKKCGAYTGFTSRRKSSARRDIDGLKITKAGNRRLKRDLALAADTAMKVDAELAAFAIRLLRAGKHFNEARVAVGRKLFIRGRALLRRYAAGQHAAYVWRDPLGRPIDKHRAKQIAGALWADYKKQTGSSLSPAHSWQSEDSIQRHLNELPEDDHD